MAGVFGGKKVETPPVKPPVPMPDANDPAVLAAEQRRRRGMMAMGGRRSTLAQDGGGSIASEYSQDKMG